MLLNEIFGMFRRNRNPTETNPEPEAQPEQTPVRSKQEIEKDILNIRNALRQEERNMGTEHFESPLERKKWIRAQIQKINTLSTERDEAHAARNKTNAPTPDQKKEAQARWKAHSDAIAAQKRQQQQNPT